VFLDTCGHCFAIGLTRASYSACRAPDPVHYARLPNYGRCEFDRAGRVALDAIKKDRRFSSLVDLERAVAYPERRSEYLGLRGIRF